MRKKIINYENILILVFMILSYVLIMCHEPWRDEAQGWLIAKNLDVFGIIKQMKYEGHPCLWHLVLHCFTKLGFNYGILMFIPWGITCFSVAFFVKKINASLLSKTFIVFSPTFLIYASGLARSYCLVLLIILIIAFLYPNREKYPWVYGVMLFLLINTHIFASFFVGTLLLIDFYEMIIEKGECDKKSRYIYLIIAIIAILGFLFLIFQLYMCFTVRNSGIKNFVVNNILYFLVVFFDIFKGNANILFLTLYECILFFIFFWQLFKDNKKLFLVLSLNIIFEIFVYVYIYGYSNYMSLIFYAIIIFCFVNAKLKKEIIIQIFFALTIPYSIKLFVFDIKETYSLSYDVALYINNEMDNDEVIACYSNSVCESIVPYINNKMINVFTLEEVEYETWIFGESNKESLEDCMKKSKFKYLIVDSDKKIEEMDNNNSFVLVKKFVNNIEKYYTFEENYYIYMYVG